MFTGGIFSSDSRTGSVADQDAMIADLDAISRRRHLSAQESDLLAELVRRAKLREYWRARRRSEQMERAAARLARLTGRAVPA